jgi:hypothetical protein
LGIPRHGRASGFALEKAQISDQRPSSGGIKSAERGHAGGWNSIVDDLPEHRIGASLRFRRRRNVRCALTTATVYTVTPCAPILKNLASIGNRPLQLWYSGRTLGSFFDTKPVRGDRDPQCERASGGENSAAHSADELFAPTWHQVQGTCI